jgi:hypothetical protein
MVVATPRSDCPALTKHFISQIDRTFCRITLAKTSGKLSCTSHYQHSPADGPFIRRIERRYAPFAASAIPADRFAVVPRLHILSSSSSAPGSTFYSLDPFSDIGWTILECDAIGLAAGEKFHRALVDECHVPQIQHYLLPRSLQSEKMSELLDIFCFNSTTEREGDSAID